MDFDYNTDTWKIIDKFFEYDKYYLTKHHLDSYNDFIINKIPQTLQQYNPQKLYKELDKSTNKFKYETHIYYGGKEGKNIYLGHPIIIKDNYKKKMFPNEARLRNLNYVSYINCDIDIEYIIRIDNTEVKFSKTFKKINIGKIPIMLHSKLCVLNNQPFNVLKNMGECPYDQGGYFIIGGQEKVIVSHERKAENKLYIVKSQDELYSYSAQIKSVPNNTFKYARTTVVNINDKTNEITVRLPSVRINIPLFILFRALGVESDKEILEYILYNLDNDKSQLFMEFLRISIESTGPIYTQEIARKYLATLTEGNSISHLMDIIKTDVFPHMGDSVRNKSFYLGYVVHKLINVYYGFDQPTDRDSFVYKRVDLSGFLMASLFRENFKQFQRDTKIEIDSEYRFNGSQYQNENYENIINEDNLQKIFNPNVIDNGMMKSFKIGTILNKKGLIQSLNRLSNIGFISHLRRINTYGDNIMIGQRKLHPTQYGIICPVETPDGGNIGIKKHLTVTGHITFGCDPKPIIELLLQLGLIKLENLCPQLIFNKTKILINGELLGIHDHPDKLVIILKLFRRNAIINIFTSIFWDIHSMEISILTDGGRCCRPLYILNNNKLMVTKKHLELLKNKTISWINLVGGFSQKEISYYNCNNKSLSSINILDYNKVIKKLEKTSSVIEFIDTDEMCGVNLSTNIVSDDIENPSHCEIHSSLIMGILGFTIPFVNTSQAPRNVYGTGQTKQSVGVYTSNFRNRFDTSAHVLYYPQKPLITTRLSKYGYIDKLPTGINAIVAIGSYSGYNQDDSVIINKSSMERGIFNSCYFKTYDDIETSDSRNNTEDFFYNPHLEEDIKRNELNYEKVNKNGRIEEGIYVTDNDVIISKYTQIGIGSDSIKIDNSKSIKQDGYGVVDKVFSDYYNSNNQQITKVRICTHREPTLGDKFASRHGQKGVIGMILSQQDMPYTKDGIVPDIIINPHAIPSRMTLGQLVECVLGKSAALNGFMADATPFTNIDNNEIFDLLEKNNYNRHSDEILYSGITGKQLKTKLFIGPTYYQRLKHMVKDKINSRGEGPMTLKNRQPPAGRALGGGLRIGEMERDAIISHGTMGFLKETMFDRSDAYETYISSYSGMTPIINKKQNINVCPSTDGPIVFSELNEYDMKLINKNSTCEMVKVKIPYNTHMMIQECNAMGISMRLVIDNPPKHKKLKIPNSVEKKFELQDKDSRKIIKTQKSTKNIPINAYNNNLFINEMNNNKIIVKNLPDDINIYDIKNLFDTIGEIYNLRNNNFTHECIIVFTKSFYAEQSINRFNNTLLDNNTISVNFFKGDYFNFKIENNNNYNVLPQKDFDYSLGYKSISKEKEKNDYGSSSSSDSDDESNYSYSFDKGLNEDIEKLKEFRNNNYSPESYYKLYGNPYQQTQEINSLEQDNKPVTLDELFNEPNDGPHTPDDGPHTPNDGPHTPNESVESVSSPNDGPHTPNESVESVTSPNDGPHTPNESVESVTENNNLEQIQKGGFFNTDNEIINISNINETNPDINIEKNIPGISSTDSNYKIIELDNNINSTPKTDNSMIKNISINPYPQSDEPKNKDNLQGINSLNSNEINSQLDLNEINSQLDLNEININSISENSPIVNLDNIELNDLDLNEISLD